VTGSATKGLLAFNSGILTQSRPRESCGIGSIWTRRRCWEKRLALQAWSHDRVRNFLETEIQSEIVEERTTEGTKNERPGFPGHTCLKNIRGFTTTSDVCEKQLFIGSKMISRYREIREVLRILFSDPRHGVYKSSISIVTNCRFLSSISSFASLYRQQCLLLDPKKKVF